jgi:hypothetical protein
MSHRNMPHSTVSSTGSDHGTVTLSSINSFDPERDGATMSSQLNPDYSRKLPDLRAAANKYGRWNQRPSTEYVINTSAIGRAFPNFAEAAGSDTSSTFSLNLGRAPLGKQQQQQSSPKTRSPLTTLTNIPLDFGRPKSPIFSTDLGRPKSPIMSTVADSCRKAGTFTKRPTTEMQPNVADADDSTTRTNTYTRNSRFTQNLPASPNVSTKRQQQTTTYTNTHAQHSFALPAATSNSNSATFNNGVPVTTQGGRVHARRSSRDLVQTVSFGPVQSIVIPDEEETLYLAIELLKSRVLRNETENAVLKEENERLKTSCEDLKESQHEFHTMYEKLAASHSRLILEHSALEKSYKALKMSHDELGAYNKQLADQNAALEKTNEQFDVQLEALGAQIMQERSQHHMEKRNVSALRDIIQNQHQTAASVSIHEDPAASVPAHDNVSPFRNNQNLHQKHAATSVSAHENASSSKNIRNQHQKHATTSVPAHEIVSPSRDIQNQYQHRKLAAPSVPKEQHQKHPVLSTSARHVLDSLCPEHRAKNCMLCTRVTSFGDKTTGGAPIRSANPVPVSKRMPATTSYEDEPTIRPSIEPGLALATVIKGLEDEIAHLKMRQSEVQAQYQNLDASLGKRERRRIGKELESLLQQLEFKGDQLYGLYDALEGIQ